MDDENKKLRELGYKINRLKQQGKKKVEWKLTNTERKFVEDLLGEKNVVPTIYKIRTKSFEDLHNIKSSIIREIHYANKAGKKTIGRSLNKKEKEELDKNKIRYVPDKCIIYLN